jgi:hypothetical protein
VRDWIFPEGFSEADIPRFAGFVYRVTCRATGRAYIGKKFLTKRRGKKVAESNWRSYFGSSTDLHLDILERGKDAFDREILSLHPTQAETDFAEVEAQFMNRVLSATLPDGSRRYYNRQIAGHWFHRDKPADR